MLDLRRVAAAYEQVADGELPSISWNSSSDRARERCDSRYGSYFFSAAFEIEPVKVGIVEEIALDAPGFVVHLLPFLPRIHAHFDPSVFSGVSCA